MQTLWAQKEKGMQKNSEREGSPLGPVFIKSEGFMKAPLNL
jgi:hypothetical protein